MRQHVPLLICKQALRDTKIDGGFWTASSLGCPHLSSGIIDSDAATPAICRVLRVFWDITIGMYSAGELPQRFLERGVWLTRARLYMELVEPVEIANYYRCKNWEKWAMGRRHYIEGKRPKRFEFIEAQFVAHYPGEALAPVLARARREADAVDFAELRMARAGAQPVPAAQELQQ